MARLLDEDVVPDDTSWVDDEWQCQEEIERWRTFGKVLGLIGKQFRTFKKKVKAVQADVTSYIFDLERKLEERFPGDEIPDDRESYRSTRAFDVAALFEDL